MFAKCSQRLKSGWYVPVANCRLNACGGHFDNLIERSSATAGKTEGPQLEQKNASLP